MDSGSSFTPREESEAACTNMATVHPDEDPEQREEQAPEQEPEEHEGQALEEDEHEGESRELLAAAAEDLPEQNHHWWLLAPFTSAMDVYNAWHASGRWRCLVLLDMLIFVAGSLRLARVSHSTSVVRNNLYFVFSSFVMIFAPVFILVGLAVLKHRGSCTQNRQWLLHFSVCTNYIASEVEYPTLSTAY